LPESPDNQWPDVPTDPDQEAAEQTTVVTVGEEQLQRSLEMQEMGIDNWVRAHDERDPDYQQQQVAGVTPLER
jgi:electron transfer flavoprotein alpha/beta subunit